MKKHYCSIGNIKDTIKELNPVSNPKYDSLDDVSRGRLFADVFKEYARYNTTLKSWYVYNGIVWEEDTGDMIVERYAKQLYKTLYLYAFDKDDNYRKYVSCMGNRNVRVKMILDARENYHIRHEDLDVNEDLLNVQNGVINLKTFELMKHSPDLLLSKVANVFYNPGCKSKEFERFFSEIMCRDVDKSRYVQKICGLGLTCDTSEEECYMLYGATTRNGKSTLLETLHYMLGDYAMNIQPETLAQKKKDSRAASGDIARLNEVRFLHMSEPPKRMIFDIALLKTLLGRDTITARQVYERDFEFVPKFKLFINTNYLPTVNDDTLFTSGRIKVVSFDRHFEEEEQDKLLKDKLKTKENLSGLLNWCLDGLKLYYEEGITPPLAVVNATNDYREKSDKIRMYIDDCLTEDKDSVIKAMSVYENYSEWCKSNGFGTENKSNFFDELRTKNLLSETGTIKGETVRNVIKGYRVEEPFKDVEEGKVPF